MFTAAFTFENRPYRFASPYETDWIFRCWAQKRTFYEIRLLQKLRTLRPEGVFLDLGAHLGNHAVFFATQCACERLVAVEATPEIARVLDLNLRTNAAGVPCEIHTWAIGDRTGTVEMSRIDPKNSGARKVLRARPAGAIHCTTLDALFGGLRNVGLLKMDIEGCETPALKGAAGFFRDNRPIIAAELGFKALPRFRDFRKEIERYGYTTDGKNYAATPTYIWTPSG